MRGVRAVLSVFLLGFSLAATAQYPAKPVRVVVPFPAGSATDTVARIVANGLTDVGPLLVG